MRALARINLAAIERNCAALVARARPAALCAVVKADGYGHGAVAVARAAQAGGASWLAVATAGEAAALRAGGIGGAILVLGALAPDELRVALDARADVVAWREDFVTRLAETPGAEGCGVHVKLDTGMGRLGTRDPAEGIRVARAVAGAPTLRLAGAMTHLATADDDPAFMHTQLERFGAWGAAVKAEHPQVLLHAANSAATLGEPSARFDVVRCGIAIYGMDPFHRDPAEHGLEPALELCSYVAEVKRCASGESAGYGRTFQGAENTWVATVPIGYGDGVRRALSNRADVLVGGRRTPIAGTVSMDNLTVDLGDAGAATPCGTEVVLIGRREGEQILAEDLASRLETITYEVTCGITARVPRSYHRDGADEHARPDPDEAVVEAVCGVPGQRLEATAVDGSVRR
jgi:alanine racemase